MRHGRRHLQTLTALALLALLVGCGAVTKEGVYEGLKTRERIVNPPETTLPSERTMTYPEYEEERKKMRGEKP
jgi:hypothetical protein